MPSTTWFVTGASSGIGAGIVEAALAKGDKVIASSRDALKLSEAKSKGAVTVSFNVNGTTEEVAESVQNIIKEHGPVDVVVNNAGFAQPGGVEDNGAKGFARQFATNFYGPINVINAFLPHFRERRLGYFINIGSAVNYLSIPFHAPYTASKAALNKVSTCLDGEVKGLGIRSIIIEPGVIKTAALKRLSEAVKNKTVFPDGHSDYDEGKNQTKEFFKGVDDLPSGSPHLLGQLLVKLAHQEGPFAKEVPSVLSVGGDTSEYVNNYANEILERNSKWKEVSSSIDNK